MDETHPARIMKRRREFDASVEMRAAIAEIELAEQQRWRSRAEGLLTGGEGLHEVIAALCADATTEEDVYDRLRAIAEAVEDLGEAELLRDPLRLALARTLAELLEWPQTPRYSGAEHYALVCARVRRHQIPLPHDLLSDR